MNIWLVGDSIIRDAVTQFANDRGAMLIDTSTENATPEEVWCNQIHDDQIRVVGPRLPDLLAIAFINIEQYDSENTCHQIARRLPADKQMFYLVYPTNSFVEDGPKHEGNWIKIGILDSLDHASVLSKLRELYAT